MMTRVRALVSAAVLATLAFGTSYAARSEETGEALQMAQSQGGACFKTDEWVSGFNKNCVYDCTGSEVVRTIGSTQLCPLTLNNTSPPPPPRPPAQKVCFKKREWVSGFNKNCVYDCTGSERVVTIGSTQLCPINLN